MVIKEKPAWQVTVIDKLTYAGRLENLREVEKAPQYNFVQGDICDPVAVQMAMDGCDAVINFAAETHVDRSIDDPAAFVKTDIEGVRVLLEEFKKEKRYMYLQISTDEVYGSVETGHSKEDDTFAPRSPYAASKAGGELLAMSYFTTWGIPVVVTRASNNYGHFQYPEKLIPLFITNAFKGEALPLYGDGLNKRDWLFVDDHCKALMTVLEKAEPGEIFNIGAGEERSNREVTESILRIVGADKGLIKYISDRPGHDRRYALDISHIREKLSWEPLVGFEEGLRQTVEWYRDNSEWWEEIKSGRFKEYYKAMYADRLEKSGGGE